MKNNYNFSDFTALTETELTDVIGGGGLSDLVVRGLTAIGDAYTLLKDGPFNI